MDGKILKITFSKSTKSTPAAFQERELNIEKCSLVSLERVELTSDNGQHRAHFKCIIRHILREKGDYVDGEGEGSELSNEMGVALDYAKKKAVTDARKTAFGKMVIILLSNSKVAIHLVGGKSKEQEKTKSQQEDIEIYNENSERKRKRDDED